MAGEAQQGRTCGRASARHAKNEKTKAKWIPAFAGMTEWEAFAGMTARRNTGDSNFSAPPRRKNKKGASISQRPPIKKQQTLIPSSESALQ
jgi:hypothetical protein